MECFIKDFIVDTKTDKIRQNPTKSDIPIKIIYRLATLNLWPPLHLIFFLARGYTGVSPPWSHLRGYWAPSILTRDLLKQRLCYWFCSGTPGTKRQSC